MQTLGLVGLAVLLGIGLCGAGWSIAGVELFPNTKRRAIAVVVGIHNFSLWVAGAFVVAALVMIITGWAVAALWALAGVCSVPLLRHNGPDPKVEIERVEAIATWADQIRDTLAASAGIQQAMIVTAQRPPTAIAEELTRFSFFASRDLSGALRRLGNDLAHPSADMVIVGLLAAIELDAGRVSELLMRLTESIRAEAAMRVRVEVSRARIRTSWRIVSAALAATSAVLVLFGQGLTAVYSTLAGQLWLVLIGMVVAGSVAMSHRLAQIPQPARFVSRERLGTNT